MRTFLIAICLFAAACAGPAEGRLGDASADLESGLSVSDTFPGGEGAAGSSIGDTLRDHLHDCWIGWSMVGRAVSRNVARDWVILTGQPR